MLKRADAPTPPLKHWRWARVYGQTPPYGDPQREPRADLRRSLRKHLLRSEGVPSHPTSTNQYFPWVLGSRFLYSSSRPLSLSWFYVVYWRIGREVSICLPISTLPVLKLRAFSNLNRNANARNRYNNIRRRTCGHSPSPRVSNRAINIE